MVAIRKYLCTYLLKYYLLMPPWKGRGRRGRVLEYLTGTREMQLGEESGIQNQPGLGIPGLGLRV